MKKVLYVLSTILMLTLLIVGMTLSASAEEDVIRSGTWGDLTWELNETTGHLTISGRGAMNSLGGYTSTSAWLAYQSSIKFITIEEGVTSIGTYAFHDCSNLADVEIPFSIVSIDIWAFEGCSSLANVIFDDNSQLTNIGTGAFRGCESLSYVDIPPSVLNIGSSAFSGCNSLTSIQIPSSVTSIGRGAFECCYNLKNVYIRNLDAWLNICSNSNNFCYLNYYGTLHILDANEEEITNIVIPSSITSVGDYAFYNCSGLTSIEFLSNVVSIGDYAFQNCSSLASVTFDNNSQLTDIGDYAFYECSNLINIKIPRSVTCIGKNAFYLCRNLKDAYITNLESWLNICLDENNYCYLNNYGTLHILDINDEEVTNLVIPLGISRIGKYALANCGNLTKIEISSSVVDIGYGAFRNCNVLTYIEIPSGVTSIGSASFEKCSSLENITFKENSQLTSIGSIAFDGCNSLSSVMIPSSVTFIGWGAFNGCQNLKDVYVTDVEAWLKTTFEQIPNIENQHTFPNYYGTLHILDANGEEINELVIPSTISIINTYVFYNCINLTSVSVSSSVTKIGSYAFYNCNGLMTVTFETDSQLACIDYAAFSNCSSLTTIELPSSVTKISTYAFYKCSQLTNFVIPSDVTSIGSYAFSECSSLTSIEIPSKVASISSYMFKNCSNLKNVTFENNSQLTSIGYAAFYNCRNLTSIEIPPIVTSIGSQAFYYCMSVNVYITDVKAWLNISFGDWASYPNYSTTGYSNYNGTLHILDVNGDEITDLVIPSTVTYIGEYAFSNCRNLVSIEIPHSVLNINKYAFSNCKSLTNVKLLHGVTSISSYAFNKCYNFTIIYCGTSEQWNAIKKDNNWGSGYTLQYHNYVIDSAGITYCTICGQVIPIVFEDSMWAFLNLEEEITMSVGYMVEGMESMDVNALNGRFGLLIWRTGDLPEVFDYENCDYIVSGAIYNPEKGRFETTSLGIAAKNLGDQLYFRAYFINKDGSYSYSRLIEDYSPKTYCYNQINNNPDEEELVHLMASILNYGTAAQIHFNYRTTDLMNSDLAADLQEMNWDGSLLRSDYSVADNKDSAFVRDASVTSRGGYLDLQGAIDYNFYAKVDFEPVTATIYYWTESDVAKLDELTLDNATSSESMKWVAENNRWEGKYEGQAAKRMFNTVYACMVFEDAEGNTVCSGVVGYSPERYAYINQNKGDTNAELAKRLAVYGDAARAYFN